MIKYIKLYFQFLKFSLSKSMQFRFDFTFRILMDCIFYFTNIAFFKIIFLHTPKLGGWTQDQVLIFVSGFLVVDALQMTFFSNNIWMIPTYINKGDLDYYLLRPVSDLFFLCLRDFAVNSFVNLIIAVVISAYFISTSDLSFTSLNIVIYGLLLLNGSILHMFIRLILIIPVFWTHSGRGLEMAFWTLERFAEKPDAIYRGVLRYFLMFVMPFVAISSFPARLLFGEEPGKILIYTLGITFLFAVIAIKLWKIGLKSYSSASS